MHRRSNAALLCSQAAKFLPRIARKRKAPVTDHVRHPVGFEPAPVRRSVSGPGQESKGRERGTERLRRSPGPFALGKGSFLGAGKSGGFDAPRPRGDRVGEESGFHTLFGERSGEALDPELGGAVGALPGKPMIPARELVSRIEPPLPARSSGMSSRTSRNADPRLTASISSHCASVVSSTDRR